MRSLQKKKETQQRGAGVTALSGKRLTAAEFPLRINMMEPLTRRPTGTLMAGRTSITRVVWADMILAEVDIWIKVPSTLITEATFTLLTGALDAEEEGVLSRAGDAL